MENKKVLDDSTLQNGKTITSYLAAAYAEGFDEGDGASWFDQIKAWAYLIKTGQCWQLQGWFGRTAQTYIQNGFISDKGIIDWDAINARINEN